MDILVSPSANPIRVCDECPMDICDIFDFTCSCFGFYCVFTA